MNAGAGSDAEEIARIIEQAEVDYFDERDAEVIKDAIERLYYTQSLRIGGAVYPGERVRFHLKRLDFGIVEDAIGRIAANMTKIRNSGAYVTVVLFNTIMESKSSLALDPYLNYARSAKSDKTGGRRGDEPP